MTTIRRPPLPQIAKIDMTPMVGILIVLMIIFMTNIPLVCKCGAQVQLPSVRGFFRDLPEGEARATVALYRDLVFLQGRLLESGLSELKDALRAHFQQHPDIRAVVYLKADVLHAYGEVNRVMTACREAGATDVTLLAEARLDPNSLRAFDLAETMGVR